VSRRRLALALLAIALASPAAAQGGAAARAIADAAAAQEILDVRERLRAAVARKDGAALGALYAETFQHLRDTGRIDLKGERVALLLAGTAAIETAPEDEMTVQVHGPATAVAVGTSRVRDAPSGQSAPYRWVAVYVKGEGGWRIAFSQANRANQAR
jgi:hypothetical protein